MNFTSLKLALNIINFYNIYKSHVIKAQPVINNIYETIQNRYGQKTENEQRQKNIGERWNTNMYL